MVVDNKLTSMTQATPTSPANAANLVPDLVSGLTGIGLSELNSVASLQTRQDRKYLLPLTELHSFFTQLMQLDGGNPADHLRMLEIEGSRSFRYQSVYFDTPDLRSYLDAAQDRPRRCKIRTRTYVNSGLCSLEVKTRDGRGQTVKQRLPYPLSHQSDLTPEGHSFIGGNEGVALDHRTLVPVLTTRYRRSTLLLRSSLGSASDSRLTIDTDLGWQSPDGKRTELAGYALLETKTTGKPSAADRLLWGHHTRPVKISKYCTGLAALNPNLSANKWHRLLRTYFDWTPRRDSPVRMANVGWQDQAALFDEGTIR